MFRVNDMVHSDFYGVGFVHRINNGPYPVIVNFKCLNHFETFTKNGKYCLPLASTENKNIYLIPEVPAECSLNYQAEQELNYAIRKRSFFRTLQRDI